jgi:hypothetical protein
MKANVGGFDRILRIAFGALLTVLAALNVIGVACSASARPTCPSA